MHTYYADIPTTFPIADIDVQLYMSCKSVVYKVESSLYKLKQSLRLCYEKVRKTLEEFGLKQTASC